MANADKIMEAEIQQRGLETDDFCSNEITAPKNLTVFTCKRRAKQFIINKVYL